MPQVSQIIYFNWFYVVPRHMGHCMSCKLIALFFFTRLLLEQGDARVDCRDQTGGRTPLLLAARARQEAAVRLLVENGADPDLACGKVTPREVLRQELPRLNIEKITVRERPVENTVEMLAQLVERKGRGEEEEKRSLAIFKGVLAFLGVEEVRISDQTLNINNYKVKMTTPSQS